MCRYSMVGIFYAKWGVSMYLNVSEDQKKVIELQGYMVVEFKLWYRKLGEMILEYARKSN